MDTDCNVLASTGSLGFDPGQMYYPRGILVQNGLVYVNDVVNNRVQIFDTDFNYQTLFGGATVFAGPMSMALTAEGDYIVVDTGNYQVKVFDPANLTAPYATWGQQRTAEGYFNAAGGVVHDPEAGELYITDIGNSRVQVYDFETAELKRTFGQFGLGTVAGDIYGARAISLINDLLYVTTSTHEVVVFDKAGNQVQRVGSFGFGPGQFYYPYEVQADSQGNFFVSDNFNNRVQKFDSDWNYLTTIGSFGYAVGQMYMPSRMYIDQQDRLFVSDTFNNRIQVFNTQTGESVGVFGGYGQQQGQIFLPYAITMDRNEEYIVIGESGNNRISVFKNDANFTFHRFFSSIGATDTDVFFPSGLSQCGGRWDFCITSRMQNTTKRFKLKIKGHVAAPDTMLTPWF
jgi:DNA-binding beta-propeller fold protein YncE